jgi:uncharacterized RDD family membrane protein YckC
VAAQPPNPGWYPDPGGRPATQRWWDGGTWSPVTREAPAGSSSGAPGPAAPRGDRYGAAGAAGTAEPRALATPDGVPLAGFGVRALARALDAVLKSVISLAIGYRLITPAMDAFRQWWDRALLASQRGRPTPAFDVLSDVEVQRALGEYTLLSLLVAGLYTVLLLRLWGATLGKRALGLRVRSWSQDGQLSWGQAVGRWVTGEGVATVPLFSVFWPVLNYLWPLWDRRRQALHDKLPGTVVVRAGRPARTLPAQAPWT